jgi:hypothetical protein
MYVKTSLTEKLVERVAFAIAGAVVVAVVRYTTKKVEKRIDRWQESRKVRTPSKEEIDKLYIVRSPVVRTRSFWAGLGKPVTEEDITMSMENIGNV